MRTFKVTKIFEFEAAHCLPEYVGDCSKIHGHSYKLEVTLKKICNNHLELKEGMVADFSLIKKMIDNHILGSLDHSFLNDVSIFHTDLTNPTAEIMADLIFSELESKVSKKFGEGVVLHSIKLWETSTSFAECTKE